MHTNEIHTSHFIFTPLNSCISLRSAEFSLFWVSLITSSWCHSAYSLGYRLLFCWLFLEDVLLFWVLVRWALPSSNLIHCGGFIPAHLRATHSAAWWTSWLPMATSMSTTEFPVFSPFFYLPMLPSLLWLEPQSAILASPLPLSSSTPFFQACQFYLSHLLHSPLSISSANTLVNATGISSLDCFNSLLTSFAVTFSSYFKLFFIPHLELPL